MEAEEFDDFYTASFDRLVAQVYAMTGNRDEAQECVQEAFVRAWSHRRKRDRAQAPRGLGAYDGVPARGEPLATDRESTPGARPCPAAPP